LWAKSRRENVQFYWIQAKKYRKDLLDVETILQSSLKPVSPRPEFIKNLQKGLMEYSFPEVDSSEVDLKKTILFAMVGLTGMVFVLSIWVRLIVVIISALGMIQSSKKKN
jgi:hypothetical protein